LTLLVTHLNDDLDRGTITTIADFGNLDDSIERVQTMPRKELDENLAKVPPARRAKLDALLDVHDQERLKQRPERRPGHKNTKKRA
jgi:hypothetical protein